MPATILIVEDTNATKNDAEDLTKIFSEDYLCQRAKNCQEALDILSLADSTISAVLLDMTTVADGDKLLQSIRQNPRLAQIPVIATLDTAEKDAQARALALGAVFCLCKPVSPDLSRALLRNLLGLRETIAAAYVYRRDKLTGLFNREAFFAEAEQMIRCHPPGYYVLSCFNIASFKVVNDQYGEAVGDEVLKHVGRCFDECIREFGGICCRYMADKFATLYPAAQMHSKSILKCHKDAGAPSCINQKIRIRIGRCIVDDVHLPVGSLYDRAAMAEETLRDRYDVYIAHFHESMREQLLHEQKIVSEMYDALHGGQFETWFQPQYNHATGALIGAEALVRWRHPKSGHLIPPNQFIPAFERNGFIYELDQYVWEQVCALLRRRLDEGRNPLPISVNISRRDMLMPNFIDVLTGFTKKHQIPAVLLRLEITESAFSQSPEQIVSRIKKLIALGFTVEIDDFGSGYSSLNTLKDVPAHIVKLDMKFLENTEDSKRGGNILESVVRMAKWLDMAVIAEGVETLEQADYLKSIGCIYVQGYLYAKPMPLDDYVALEDGAKTDPRLEALRTVKNLSTNSFWDPKSMDTLIFNSYLGGACILEVRNGKIEVLRANDKYIRVIGSAGMTMSDALKLDWAAYMDKESRQRFFPALQYSIDNEDEADGEYLFYNLPGCAKKTYLRVTLRVIATSRDRLLVYCLIDNTTALRQAEEKEKEAERKRQTAAEQLQVIMDNVDASITAASIADGAPRILFANEQFYRIIGYTKEQYQAEIKTNYEFIHPEDCAKVSSAIATANTTRQALSVSYRIIRRDQSVRWMQGNISMITIPGVKAPVQIVVANDVTEHLLSARREREAASQLQAILENVRGGVCAVTFNADRQAKYIFANNEFYAMFGYTKEQFESLPHGLRDIARPEDFPMLYAALADASKKGRALPVEYRVRKRDGQEMWVHSSGSICAIDGIDDPVHIIVSIDITEQKEAGEHFRFLNEMAHEILAQPDPTLGIQGMLQKLLRFFNSDRVYIFELNDEKQVFRNTYEVCAEGVLCEFGNVQNAPLASIDFWLKAFEARDYIEIKDFEKLSRIRPAKEYLSAHKIHSLAAVPLRRGGAIIGFIGLDNTRQNHSQFGRLVALGDYLAVLLTRRDYEHKLARHAHAQEQMMRDMPGGYVKMRITPNGVVPIFMNEEFCRLCKMTYQQAMQLYARDAYAGVHPDDVDSVRTALKTAVTNISTVALRLRFLCGSGEYAPLQVFYRVTDDADGQLYLNGYYSDAQKQDATELLRRDLLDNLPQGAGLYAYDGEKLSVLHLNKRYWELVSRKPVQYKSSSFLKAVHPEDQPAILREISSAIAQRRDFSCDARILCKNENYRRFRIAARIAPQADGSFLLYAAYSPISADEMDSRAMLATALSAIMSITPDCAFIKDGNLRYVCAGHATMKRLGVENERALVGKTDYDLMDKETADARAAAEQEILRTGKALIDPEKCPMTAEGAPQSAISKYPLRDSSGQIVGILGISRDVTKLRDTAFELETLLDVIPSGVFKYTADEHERFAYVSQSFMKRLGYTEKQFREKFKNCFREMVYEEDRDRVAREIRAYESNGGVGKFDYRIPAADGQLCWFHNEGVRVVNREGKAWYYVTVVDITALRETEAKLRLLTDSISGGLATVEYSPRGLRVLYINDGYFRFLGFERAEYMEKTAKDPLALIFSEDRRAARETFIMLVRARAQNASCVLRCRTKSGGYCWLSLRASIAEKRGDAFIINIVLYDITEQKNVEQKLRMREEEYRLATLHSNVSIGRYNIATKTLSVESKTIEMYNLPSVMEDVPYSLVKSAMISPDTAATYIAFYERIMRGESEGTAKYQRKISGQWRWVEAHFSTLFSDDRTPVSAIVSFREITEQIEQEAIYKKWTQSMRDRPESSYTLFRCNLSKNTSLDSSEGSLLRPTFPIPDTASFSDRLQDYAQNHVFSDDRKRYTSALSVAALCENYRRGTHTTILEYREIVPTGGTRWLRLTVELVEYPGSSDIMAYMLYEDIDKQKRAELQTQSLAAKDPLTGLLNRTAFQKSVVSRIAHRENDSLCVLLMLDLDGFKLINDRLGHFAGDQMLVQIGKKLRTVLRKKDLICRIGGDEFMVFLCDIPNLDVVEKKAQQICALMQKPIDSQKQVSTSIGIAVCPQDGTDFETLYRKSDIALYHVKATGKNHFAFYAENMRPHAHPENGSITGGES